MKNSFQLVNDLKGIRIEDNFKLILLDAVSLFTNIPLDMVIDCVNDIWISRKCNLPKTEFLTAV